MVETSPQRRLVTIEQFAELTALSIRTVSRLIVGGMPVYRTSPTPSGHKLGRGVRIDPDEGLDYLKNRPPPGSPPPVRRGRPPGRRAPR
jgi:hypothetical protein